MATFKKQKMELLTLLANSGWQNNFLLATQKAEKIKTLINPLISFLSRPEVRWQAAWALGKSVSILASDQLEDARIIMRRLMWSMNEESGNLGWGVPEAMGCILANQTKLAQEYSKVLLSYILETGGEDNFIEHVPLRRGVYWAAGYVACSDAALIAPGQKSLIQGVSNPDPLIAGYAAWAVNQLYTRLPAACWRQEKQNLLSLLHTALSLKNAPMTLLERDEIRNCHLHDLLLSIRDTLNRDT